MSDFFVELHTHRSKPASWLAAFAGVALAGVLPAAAPIAPLQVGTQKQLFLDDRLVQERHGVQWVMNPPHQTGELLVAADQERERAGMVLPIS